MTPGMKRSTHSIIAIATLALYGCADAGEESPRETSESDPLGHVLVPTTNSCTTGANCNGRDPVVEGCAGDAVTNAQKDILNSSGVKVGVVERRFSAICRTSWSRTTAHAPPTTPVVAAWMSANRSSTIFSATGFQVFSNMWSTGSASGSVNGFSASAP